MRKVAAWAVVCSLVGCATTPAAEPGFERERYAPTPASIRTPPEVQTRIGTLRFFDGLPEAQTVATVYAHLDFMRAVRAYLQAIPGVSMMAMRQGMDEAGMLPNYTVLLTESLLSARSLFLTQDTETVYALAWISLKGGPIVVETAPRAQGVFVDAWQRPLAETGKTGPDRGRGGRYVIVPPAYAGYVPRSEFAVESPTFGVWAVFRGFLSKGSPERAVESFKRHLKIYPLKESARPPPNMFVDVSDTAFSTVPPNDFAFFELLDDLVQAEPNAAQDPELLGLFASIGIEKGRRFALDAPDEARLTEAARVGDATARALLFAPRDAETKIYDDRQWQRIAMHPNQRFVERGARLIDAQTRFYAFATAAAAARTQEIGSGTDSVVTFRDSRGRPLDGGRAYSLTLPPNVPAAFFWSLTLYDNQTRSMLQTNRRFPSILSGQEGLRANVDGSVTLRFGPRPPRDRSLRRNWIQTVPGRGWNAILRLHGPQRPWVEGTWRPGDVELSADIPTMPSGDSPPRMYTEASASIGLPDRLDTRIGTLRARHGIPTRPTVERLYAHLDFIRAVDAVLLTLPGASSVAIRRGLREAGVDGNGVVGLFAGGMDAHSLVLTPRARGYHALTWLDLRRGAIVVESPPGLEGVLNDSFSRHVADLGTTSRDRGEDGLFLFVPAGYEGQISERYVSFVSATYGNVLMWRDLPAAGDAASATNELEEHLRIYPLEIEISDAEIEAMLAAAAAPVGAQTADDTHQDDASAEDRPRFVDLTGNAINTIAASNGVFYDQIHELVQHEPAEAIGNQLLGLLRAIGIEDGKPFAPDASRRAMLREAAVVANATARALAFRPRDPGAFRSEGSGWRDSWLGNSLRHERRGVRLLDERTTRSFLSSMKSPARFRGDIGEGSRQVMVVTDSEDRYLEGGKSYSLTLPERVPAGQGWSIVVYDPQTRSMLQAPRSSVPAISGHSAFSNVDGTVTVHFGPERPQGEKSNWIQTVPGKGWFAILRLDGPLQGWFDGSWQPGDIEPIR